MALHPHLLGPWRRALQLTIVAVVAITPFLGINGRALLRLDLLSLTLELVGQRFRIEELYLAWLFVLCLIFLFILMALTLGRVWCGWACPQTALADLADTLIKDKTLRRGRHLIALLVSLWAGATFVWYFVSPFDFFSRLVAGQLGAWPLGTTIIIAALLFVDFTFIRRLFCRDFCPYGRFQAVLIDRGTLTLQAPASELTRCIDCQSCLRVCPTGIDIRSGYQIECINCARCLDACRKIMAKQGQEGIIRYTFGQDGAGWHALLTVKTASLALLVGLLAAATLFLANHRASATFKLGRASQVSSRLTEDGRQLTFFSGSITNRRQTPQHFTITVNDHGDGRLALKGPSQFDLTGNEKQAITLAVDSPMISGPKPVPITFSLLSHADGSRIEVAAFLSPADQGHNLRP